ncbi:hypothetical protein [Sphingobacterium bambusae]|uniref:Uncharacterized protein n=1 Tax=Sphingobacterium bambusae TaxID=662858 RepID=A0ABW6BH45_9SPHI|nr:hypothetical protein [Sphingobacterium bambusae]WPL50474.1 hypothetical protein SCB77_08430 [Sphingobacterium bambusae]
MKKITYLTILIFSFSMLSTMLSAQVTVSNDSVNYEQQRQRVNKMLEERSQRFGEFDLSIQKKTGIFGIFKTKGDMQKSIDILKQVVITDNNIFMETKRLLDLKDYESDRHAALANEYDKQVSAYMKTITKLQDENDKLRVQLESMDQSDQQSNFFVYLLGSVIIILSVLVVQLFRRQKSKI